MERDGGFASASTTLTGTGTLSARLSTTPSHHQDRPLAPRRIGSLMSVSGHWHSAQAAWPGAPGGGRDTESEVRATEQGKITDSDTRPVSSKDVSSVIRISAVPDGTPPYTTTLPYISRGQVPECGVRRASAATLLQRRRAGGAVTSAAEDHCCEPREETQHSRSGRFERTAGCGIHLLTASPSDSHRGFPGMAAGARPASVQRLGTRQPKGVCCDRLLLPQPEVSPRDGTLVTRSHSGHAWAL